MNNIIINIFIIGLIGFFIINNSISFNPLGFTCNNYIFNTYLYLILSIAITLITLETIAYNKIYLNDSSIIGIFLCSIVLLIIMMMTSPKYILIKHLLFFIFLFFIAITQYPLYINNKILFNQTGITTIILLIFLSYIAINYPQYIGDNWLKYLLMALVCIIITRLVEMGLIWYNKIEPRNKYGRFISYISIIIFIMFILYDTKQVQENAKKCITADYINESLNLYLDVINLFANIYNVNNT
jgi:FtsH-binding integral membrane protein